MASENLSQIQEDMLKYLEEDPERIPTQRSLLKEVLGMQVSGPVEDVGLGALRSLEQAGYVRRARRFGETVVRITPAGLRVIEKA